MSIKDTKRNMIESTAQRQTTIANIVIGTGGSSETLLSGTFDDPETGGEVVVKLVRGGHEHTGPREVLSKEEALPSIRIKFAILPDQKRAVGCLFGFLEQLGVAEDSASRWIGNAVDVTAYREWISSLSVEDRRNRLKEQGARMKKYDPTIAKAMETGEWRDTDLGSESTDIVRKLVENVDRNGRKCYETAQKAIDVAWEYEERVKYCEGYVLPRNGVRATRHAWVEIDGSVFELTWPWHVPVDDDAVYYGTEIPRDVLEDRMADENRGYHPMILDSDEWAEFLELLW